MSVFQGDGVLVVWLDLDETRRDELDRWYVEEHFPERIVDVGYLRARRYRCISGGPAYMSVMEASSPSSLISDGYRRLTANPSERTKQMRGVFKRAIRASYAVAASHGRSVASILVCVQLHFAAQPQRDAFALWAPDHLVAWMRSHPAVLAVHALTPVREVREEMDRLRPTGQNDEWADALLLLELGRESDLKQDLRNALSVAGLASVAIEVADTSIWTYQLMFGVSADAG